MCLCLSFSIVKWWFNGICVCVYYFQPNDEVSQHARSSSASGHGENFASAQSDDFDDIVSLDDM